MDRLENAVQEAKMAFWASVAKSFPEAETGDLDPIVSSRFDEACSDAVFNWVWFNNGIGEL